MHPAYMGVHPTLGAVHHKKTPRSYERGVLVLALQGNEPSANNIEQCHTSDAIRPGLYFDKGIVCFL